MSSSSWWIITVGGGYGSFAFFGTEDAAEKRRRSKACWESAVARKELADPQDPEHRSRVLNALPGRDAADECTVRQLVEGTLPFFQKDEGGSQ